VTDVDREDLFEVPSIQDQDPVEAFATYGADPPFDERVRAGRPHGRPDCSDAVGAEHTSSNPAVNLLSRSWIKNRIGSVGSTNVSMMLRACWVAHSPVGFAVMPARYTCRVAISLNTSTYSRRSSTVSTLKKSQATIPFACARRNSRHVSDDRRGCIDPGLLQDRPHGAGRDPDTEPDEFALDPAVAPTWVLPRQPQNHRTNTGVRCRPARPTVRIRPPARD
jgi:hypothetical protein